MNNSIIIVFGKEESMKIIKSEPLSSEEILLNKKEYHFNSESEKIAFCAGINEAIGWTECYIDYDSKIKQSE